MSEGPGNGFHRRECWLLIVVTPDIREVGDLKSKTGAVNRLGTTSDLALRLALRRLGLEPERDVKLLGVGDDPTRLAAMKGGQVQFTILSGSYGREAEKLSFRSLVPMAKLGIPFHWNATLAQAAVIRTKRAGEWSWPGRNSRRRG